MPFLLQFRKSVAAFALGERPHAEYLPLVRARTSERNTSADKARGPLLVEPDVFHAPAVVDAVDHDREPLDIGLLAGRAARIEDDRSCRILRQLPFDLPYQLLALFQIGLHRLPVNQLGYLGI